MKLTQKEVSELTGISRFRYADFESGVTEYIPKDTTDKLAEFYMTSQSLFTVQPLLA